MRIKKNETKKNCPILLYILIKLCLTSQNQKQNSIFFKNGRKIEFKKKIAKKKIRQNVCHSVKFQYFEL